MKKKPNRFHIESTQTIRNGVRMWRVTNGTFSWVVADCLTAMKNCDQLNADAAENEMSKVRKVA